MHVTYYSLLVITDYIGEGARVVKLRSFMLHHTASLLIYRSKNEPWRFAWCRKFAKCLIMDEEFEESENNSSGNYLPSIEQEITTYVDEPQLNKEANLFTTPYDRSTGLHVRIIASRYNLSTGVKEFCYGVAMNLVFAYPLSATTMLWSPDTVLHEVYD